MVLDAARGHTRGALKSDNLLFDVIVCVLLGILSFYSRFCGLDHPNEVVFDEKHFGQFVSWYVRGEYFIDIHPPLGKLLMLLSGTLLGYNDHTDYNMISAPYPDYSYMYLRFMPALFGSLLVPLMYLTLRTMSLSRPPSCLGEFSPLSPPFG